MADGAEVRSHEADERPAPAAQDAAPPVTEAASQSSRTHRIQAVAQTVIAIAIVLAGLYYAQLPITVVLVSVLFAFILAPIVDAFTRMRVPRALGALLAILLFLAVLYGIFYASYTQARSFLDEFPRYSGEIRHMVVRVRQKAEKIQKTTDSALGSDRQKNELSPSSQTNWSDLISKNVGSITEVAFMVSFVPFLIYFMLTWQEHVRTQTVMLFKMENRSTAYVTLGLISSMIRSFIVGNVIVGLFMGAISMIVFGFVGLPYFYFLGFISGFLSLVPYLGVPLAIVPPVVAGLGRIHSTQIVIIVVTVLALHLFSLNVLYPKFLGSRLKLNPLSVTLALLFWGWLWGGMGLILAIPMTGALKIICDHVEPLRAYGAWLGE